MNVTPRSAPCPCGSGKKYKNCCLKNDARKRSRLMIVRGAVPRAVDWLMARHRKAIMAAIDERYCGALDDEGRAGLALLPRDLHDMYEINAMEWLLAEGTLEIAETQTRQRAIELVLGPGGPMLLAEQRAYLEELGSRPLRPYEVIESRPGEGLLLRDLLREDGPPVRVSEKRASQSLVQWDVIGARVLTHGSEHVLSGAIYSCPVEDRLGFVAAIRAALAGGAPGGGRSRRPLPEATVVSSAIIGRWLTHITAPPPEMRIGDAGSGDPLMLVTEHYEVLDWDLLARALEAEPDVDGDRKHGWTRFESLEGGARRSRLAINIGEKPNRLEPFARTLRLADGGRVWLERVAGGSIRHLTRDLVDPMSILKGHGPRLPARSREPEPGLTPARRTTLTQHAHEQIYRDWADKPVPALDDRTPRDAVKSAEGREKVVALLKLYESSEQRAARRDGRAPTDLRFLWAQVGLDRERVLAEVPVR